MTEANRFAFDYLYLGLFGRVDVRFNYLQDTLQFYKIGVYPAVIIKSYDMRELGTMTKEELDVVISDVILSSCFEGC